MSNVSDDQLQERVDDAKIEGWRVDERQGDRVVMTRHDWGSLGGHFLVALLTVWWTLGLGNLCYACYRYFAKADRRVVRADD